MTDECIHGLDHDRCDICTPKPPPPPAAKPARTSTPRATVRTAARSSAPLRRSTSASAKKPANLNEQRIHHLTHIDNLTGILVEGAVHADAAPGWQGRPEIDISSAETRDARRTTPIAGTTLPIAQYVPFFFSPDATMWEGMLARTPDPRLSASSRSLPVSEFVMLVTTIGRVSSENSFPVVADGDAADAHTRFGSAQEDAERMLRRLLADDDRLLRAELLVSGSVAFEHITLIGVAHEKARDAVREILAGSGYQPRIAVHPPWFALSSGA